MEPTHKVIALGMYGVGKTCILLRATEENFTFPKSYSCTIGVDFKTKMHSYDGQTVKLMIWDTAGQERFHHINRYYYNGCHAVMLVYDITNPDSLEKVSLFHDDFIKNSDGTAVFVLVGNKLDSNDRRVSKDQGENLANKLKIPFIECSAYTGENIEEIFDLIMGEIKYREIEPAKEKNILVVKAVHKQKKCCD
ncbi:hypothetical protein SteCoe_25266 [Stentor coeruleus]|uniref:Uncharacterized protein n=1 Tax=Stentor coeruleus TaxID=5963 RepID=A0A1R2BFP7_9CILI|nr:hypothetical protein SteCoe_25266 [Stentor coeruleus]